jgi:thioredoxin reductase
LNIFSTQKVEIDNYFGFPETISGKELIELGQKQAEKFGAKMRCEKVLSTQLSELKKCSIFSISYKVELSVYSVFRKRSALA